MVMPVDDDFGPEDYSDQPPARPLRVVEEGEAPPDPQLRLNKKGFPFQTVANTIDMLGDHPDWKGVLVWDEFAQTIRKLRAPPTRETDGGKLVCAGEWSDGDTIRTQAWLQSQPDYHRVNAPSGMVEAAILAVAERRVVHPVREWLRLLDWDGVQRCESLFVDYFGANDSLLNRETAKRWLISAVARVMQPGCQCKYMPVLEAAQDAGKSAGLAALVGSSPDGESWYSETPLRIGDKDSYQCLRAKWVHEWGELAGFKAVRDVESLKSFISSRSDNFRASYGKRSQDYPRQCVFVGTTNEERWLTDPTGGSRFWPVRGRSGRLVDVAGIAAARDQLWAEAVVRFDAGERWWIDPATEGELLRHARLEQADRSEVDPWLPLVTTWLRNPTIPDADGEGRYRPVLSEGLNATEILTGACGVRRADLNRGQVTKVGYIMRELGWVRDRRQRGAEARQWLYLPPECVGAPEPVSAATTQPEPAGEQGDLDF